MVIEVASDKQIEIVESLAKEIWAEYYVPIIGEKQVAYMVRSYQTRQAISEQIRCGFLYFLIEEHDENIGYTCVLPKGEELFLSKLYIRSSERGKGYGKKTIQFLDELARKNGLRRLVLTVNKNNILAINVYKRIGFRNLGSVIYAIGGGFVMDDYKMEKIL
jgi:ribosomal protein S18 acetylase RimI-like enzyme